MGIISITDPGTNLTKAEYLGNLSQITSEFNGNIDNANIKVAANIDADKIGSTRTQLMTFSGGMSLAAGIFSIISGSAVNFGGVNGIDFNPGSDVLDVDLLSLLVTGLPRLYWDSALKVFRTTHGINIDAGGLNVTAGGIAVDSGGISVNSGILSVVSGSALNIGGVNGVDFNPASDILDVDLLSLLVTGLPKVYWDSTLSLFHTTHGLTVDAGGLNVVSGGLNIDSGGMIVSAGGVTLSTGDLSVSSGNITVSGTVDGIDVAAHDVATTGVHGAGANTLATDADITTHAALDTGVHGSGANTLATDADITTHAALDTGVHGSGANTLATDADITTHAAINTGVHGVNEAIPGMKYVAATVNGLTGNSWNIIRMGATGADIVIGTGFNKVGSIASGIAIGNPTNATMTTFKCIKSALRTTRSFSSTNALSSHDGQALVEGADGDISIRVWVELGETSVVVYVTVLRP